MPKAMVENSWSMLKIKGLVCRWQESQPGLRSRLPLYRKLQVRIRSDEVKVRGLQKNIKDNNRMCCLALRREDEN